MSSGYGSDDGLKTIDHGLVPECRMRNAEHTQQFVMRLLQQDEKRSWKRSRVSGLVQGNPPYRHSKLRDAGRAEACNVNWGTARMYLESGSGAFYDLFCEAPGYVTIRTEHGDPDHIDEYSRIMSAEADRVLRTDPTWDYEMQQSQEQMTLHGHGPMIFEDSFKVLPRSVHDGDLKVPERTLADTEYWEVCSVDIDYYPPQLYAFIKNPRAATAIGWNIEFTKRVIANAMDIKQPDNPAYDWEFYQQEIKNNSLTYYDDSKVCKLAHVFWKEFDGSVTHVIIERMNTATQPAEYLYKHVGRYENFRQCVHPMYIDRGNGGFHHSVTGLGTKQYGPMEYENRLLCNLMDKAFAPKVLFKPTMAEAAQKFQLTALGDYGIVPKGWDVQQVPIQGFLTDGLAMFRTSTELMRSNLSSYRQQAPTKMEGNPVTARQVQLEASQSSALNKTTYNRYYRQLDFLYAEIVRRLCNYNTTDKRAKEFQRRCTAQGVPVACFGRIESVSAVRVIGQGSPFLRKQAVDSVGAVAGSLSEEGKQNWLNDKIAVEAGSSAVERYNPSKNVKKPASDQQFEALMAVTMMKVGIPPIVTSGQNPVTFAATFLMAGTQAIQSVQQGGNALEVLAFLELCGPSILAQLKRFANDPLRQTIFKQILEQWKQLSATTDKLKQMVMRQRQQQQQQAQKTQQVMSDAQIKAAKAQNDIAIKTAKAKHAMGIKSAQTRQDMALADARTASEIHRANQMAAFQE